MPRKSCLELKSLKEYLFTYRNLGIFQENIVNQVLDDVVKACDPVWAKVVGDFRPRGGISTIVEAFYPRPKALKARLKLPFTTPIVIDSNLGAADCISRLSEAIISPFSFL